MSFERGDDVVAELDRREIRLRNVDTVVAEAQARTRELLGYGPQVSVDAFIAERRGR